MLIVVICQVGGWVVDEEELLENVFFVERSLLLYVLGNPVCCSWTVVDVRLTCCEGVLMSSLWRTWMCRVRFGMY